MEKAVFQVRNPLLDDRVVKIFKVFFLNYSPSVSALSSQRQVLSCWGGG